ncbi:hypothetical protein [Methylibium rhizosphaerae]|uniref:hypothetical protein n=1 Tax=Methylibium rhizosphaerae TaxID=2570323 RepID=UPI001125D00D|nr:hypothetical protein [Methylibium rhizosphaerae]
MSNHRTALIRTAAEEACLSAEAAEVLIAECPWLDGVEEVNDSLGPELLSEQARSLHLSGKQVEEFFYCYNARVRAVANPLALVQSEAYAAMATALVGQGREDAFGEGDYWLISDSFSTRTPTIVVFNGFRLSREAVQALQRILCTYACAFSELRISSEEGAEVLTLRPQ